MQKLNLLYIKTQRQNLGISLQEMAELLGFKNASTYMKYENGIYAFKADHLPQLSQVLKCNIEHFFKKSVSKTAI